MQTRNDETKRPRWGLLIAAGFSLLIGGVSATLYATTGVGPGRFAHAVACEASARQGQPCSVVEELDMICNAVEEAEHKAFSTPTEKSTWLTRRISDGLSTKRGFQLFKDFGLANPNRKYPLLLDAAREAGAPSWRCPAIEALLGGQEV
jgi:hypothetical protein